MTVSSELQLSSNNELHEKQRQVILSLHYNTTTLFLSSSQKHLRTKVTPDFHLTYSRNEGNLGSESN